MVPKGETKADNAPELKEEKKKDEKEVGKASEKEDTGRRRDKDTRMVYSDNEYSPVSWDSFANVLVARNIP